MIILLTHYNPIQVFKAMVTGNFGSLTKVRSLFQNLAMLLCISLAVTPAFKMKFWNLGAEGQVLVGGLASAACMFYIKDALPNAVLILIMLVTSVLAGIIWGVIPAVFKAKWNANETLFTLMMNYVAIQLVSFCIMYWVPSGSAVMGVINMKSQAGWLPNLFGQKYLINILIVALLTVVMYVYLKSIRELTARCFRALCAAWLASCLFRVQTTQSQKKRQAVWALRRLWFHGLQSSIPQLWCLPRSL